MWKNIVEQDRLQTMVWRMRISCWITEATYTHSEYVILIAFSPQQWLQERASGVNVIRTLPVFSFLIYQPEDGQWKGPKHVVVLYVINCAYLYHHIVVLDRYTNSNLVYYKHNGDDEPYDCLSCLDGHWLFCTSWGRFLQPVSPEDISSQNSVCSHDLHCGMCQPSFTWLQAHHLCCILWWCRRRTGFLRRSCPCF